MAGQSLVDRVTAVKHIITGHGLAKAVCKATTEELMGPKKKHLDYLLLCTNEPNVSIPQMADLLIERTQQPNWVVVFKSLVTVHNLMNYGNERFTQYLASNNCTLNLESYLDKNGVHGYEMSTFIRRYSKYINEKAVSYRAMAFDFCKVKRGKDGLLRTMPPEKLLKSLPVLQQQVDRLLEFDCSANDLTNGVINACFMLLFKDLIRLFACYNDGIINLLESFFEMNKKMCKDSIAMYKKFLVRMDKVSEFLADAERVGIDKGDIPDLAKAPSSLLEALEQHLATLEANKKGGTGSLAKPASVTSAINSMAAASVSSSNTISEEEKRRILEDEQRQLAQLKEKREVEIALSPQNPNNPFSTSVSATADTNNDVVDLFGSSTTTATLPSPQNGVAQLSSTNPFASSFNPEPASSGTDLFGATSPAADVNPWPPAQQNTSAPPAMDAMTANKTTTSPAFSGFGDVLQPTVQSKGPQQTTPKKENATGGAAGIGKDLDSSLASLYGNLNINSGTDKKEMQWTSGAQEKKLTGGGANQGWAGTGGAPQQPMSMQYPAAAPMVAPGQPIYANRPAWPGSMMGGGYPAGITPTGLPHQPTTYPMQTGFYQPAMMQGGAGAFGGQNAGSAAAGGAMFGQTQPQQRQPQSAAVNDPFGSL